MSSTANPLPGASSHVTFPLRPSAFVDRVPSPKTQRGPPGSAGRSGFTQASRASGLPFLGWYRLFVQAVSDFSSPNDLAAAELTCRAVRGLFLQAAVWQSQFERFDRQRRRLPYPAPLLSVPATSPPTSPLSDAPEHYASSWLINDVTQEEVDDCHRRGRPVPPRAKVTLTQSEWKNLLFRIRREDVTSGGRGCVRHVCIDEARCQPVGLQVVCRAHVESGQFSSRRRPAAFLPYRLLNGTEIEFSIRSMSNQDRSRIALLIRSTGQIALAVHLLGGGVAENDPNKPFPEHRHRTPIRLDGPYVITSSARHMFQLSAGNTIGGNVASIEDFAHRPEVAVLFEAVYVPPLHPVRSLVGRIDPFAAEMRSGQDSDDDSSFVVPPPPAPATPRAIRIRHPSDYIPFTTNESDWPLGLLTVSECPLLALRCVLDAPTTTGTMKRLIFEHLSALMREEMSVRLRHSIMAMIIPHLIQTLTAAMNNSDADADDDGNGRLVAASLECVYTLLWNVSDCSVPAIPLAVLRQLFTVISYHTFIWTKIIVSTRSGGLFAKPPSHADVVLRLTSIGLMPRVRWLQQNIGCLWNVVGTPQAALAALEVPLMFWAAVECLSDLTRSLEGSGSLPASAVFSLAQFVACVLHHAPLGSFAAASRAVQRNLREFANRALVKATAALLHRTTSQVQIGAVVACRDTVEYGVVFVRHGRHQGVINYGALIIHFAYFLAAGVELPPPQMLLNEDEDNAEEIDDEAAGAPEDDVHE